MAKIEFKVTFPQNFDFTKLSEVVKWLEMLSADSKIEFLRLMREKNNKKFVELLSLPAARPHRAFVLANFDDVLETGMLVRIDIDRLVLNNPEMASQSTADIYVSDFSVASKTAHILLLAQKNYEDTGRFGGILVIAGSQSDAKSLTTQLGLHGYATLTENAPTESARSMLPKVRDRHDYLVTPKLFTGPSFNSGLTLIVSFSETQQPYNEIAAIERHAAWSGCTHSALFFRKDEPGLAKAAEVFIDLDGSFPFRM